jgi:hypothetical protein
MGHSRGGHPQCPVRERGSEQGTGNRDKDGGSRKRRRQHEKKEKESKLLRKEGQQKEQKASGIVASPIRAAPSCPPRSASPARPKRQDRPDSSLDEVVGKRKETATRRAAEK